jgi:hypothetical protein
MEEVANPDAGVTGGYERTTLRQFNVFLENRVGRLSLLLHALEDGGQAVNAISIEQSADAALVRLICADAGIGRRCLLDAGFSFSESDVIGVMLPPGQQFPLIGICRALLAAEINIHYAYPMLRCTRGSAIVLYVDDRTLAAQILLRKNYTIIGETDLKGPVIEDE